MPNGDSAQFGNANGTAIARGHDERRGRRLVGLGPPAAKEQAAPAPPPLSTSIQASV